MSTLEVRGVPGIPEVRPGDDLAALVATALAGTAVADAGAARADSGAAVRDGDVVVVTSKVVSKAEGRLLRAVQRDDAVDSETVEVVAEWHTAHGRTRVARTRHGLVLAAAGVDASNVERKPNPITRGATSVAYAVVNRSMNTTPNDWCVNRRLPASSSGKSTAP